MPVPDTITIERFPDETPRAYAARVEYIVAGPQRSLDRLRQQIGNRSVRYLEIWSSRHDWVECARKYDEQVAFLTSQEALDKYRADLEAHRDRARKAGGSLYVVAGQLLNQLNDALGQPKKIKGEDGKVYTLHGIELNSTTLTTVAKALQTALDLEAHALGVDKLLPSLEADNDSEQT